MKYPTNLTNEQVNAMLTNASSVVAKTARAVCKEYGLSACVSTRSDFPAFVKDVTTLTSDKDLEHAMFSKVKWGLYDAKDMPRGSVDKTGIPKDGSWTLADVKTFRALLIKTMLDKKEEKKNKKNKKSEMSSKRPVDKKAKHVPHPSSAKMNKAKAKLASVKPPRPTRSAK